MNRAVQQGLPLAELLAVSKDLLLELIGSTQAFASAVGLDGGDKLTCLPEEADRRELLRLLDLIDRARGAIKAVSDTLATPWPRQ